MGIQSDTIAPARDTQPPAPANGAPGLSGADALEAALRDMTESFSRDFIAGRVGRQHNTFEHRSRVLRQLATKLADMRTQEAAPVS